MTRSRKVEAPAPHRNSTPRQEDGSIQVSFPDVPEVLTEGETEVEALAQAQGCLVAALGGYAGAWRTIPRPSPARGLTTVPLPVLTTAKIALYDAMRRLIDLDHRSHIGQIETTLRAPEPAAYRTS